MDVLLKEVNYDFKFTAYRCLATSKSDGLMEFVEGSKTIQEVQLKNNNNLAAYLNNLSKDEERKK